MQWQWTGPIHADTASSYQADAFHVLVDCGHLAPYLLKKEVGRLAQCARFLENVSSQIPVLRVQGCDCASLRKLYRYLKRVQAEGQIHVHARLAVDELVDVHHFLHPALETLLLQPVAFNWNPYALVREVGWLREFFRLKHVELSLDARSAAQLAAVLRGTGALPRLASLAMVTNEACAGFWEALVAQPRPCLKALCVNGVRLEAVSFENLRELAYLWICRPVRTHGFHRFFQGLAQLPRLRYLATCDWRGLARPPELAACLAALGPEGAARLKYWETHQSDVADVALLATFLEGRRATSAPLTVQGVAMQHDRVAVNPGGHWLLAPSHSNLPLHRHRLYRSLDDVLDEPIHAYIPAAAGGTPTVLRGLGVV